MPDRSPDTYPAPYEDFQNHGRPLLPAIGGSPPIDARQPTRRYPAFDPDQARRAREFENMLGKSIPLSGSAIAVGAVATVIQAGGPDVGFTWAVRRLFVGPPDLAAYFAGAALTGVSTVAYRRPAAGDRSSYAALSSTQAWPAQATWGENVATIEGGDSLWVEVYGAPAGTVIVVGGEALQTASEVVRLRSSG